MKRLIKFGVFTVFLAISLMGCADGTQNTSNTVVNTTTNLGNSANSMTGNMANSNTIIVTNANSSNMMGGTNPTDPKGFMTQAAAGGLAEVELGRMASTKAQNPEVKKFAQMMVQDHTNANTELKSLAGKKNVTLPTELDAEHKAIRDRLNGLSGAEFDKAYMEAMVEDHEKTVDLFETQSEDGTDPDAKAFAAKTLPKLREHLKMAESIEDKLQ
jgi:putative membrane protein